MQDMSVSALINPNLKGMTIDEIAFLIRKDWKNIDYTAKPYFQALEGLDNNGNYGADSGLSMVAYFLCNASKWKGDVAREVKKELNARLKAKSLKARS